MIRAQISIQGPLARDRTIVADTVYAGSITVKNESESLQRVAVSSADYHYTHTGENYFDPPGTRERSNASWLEFSPSRLLLPPGGEQEITYTVDVPATQSGDSLAGSYWSVLLIEMAASEEMRARTAPDRSETFQMRIRYAVQIATHIESKGTRDAQFLNVDMAKDENPPVVQVDVKNTGNELLVPEASMELFDVESGQSIDRIDGPKKRIYPSTSVRYTYDLSDLPTGSYQALILMQTDAGHAFGGQYQLSL